MNRLQTTTMLNSLAHIGFVGGCGSNVPNSVDTAPTDVHEDVQKPNIVFVLTDQWRAQATGFSGDPNLIGKTPNLDRIADSGINFRNAISTTPVYTPHRAALIMNVCPFAGGIDEYRSVYTRRFSYVETLDGPSMFFDMENDPLQMNNLVDIPEHEELQNHMSLVLQRDLEKVGDEFMPRQYYIDKWNYQLNEYGHSPYGFVDDIESAKSGGFVFQGPSLNKR